MTVLDVLKQADGWVAQNIRKYGNSVVPETAIKAIGSVADTEKLLTVICGKTAKITVSKSDELGTTYIVRTL